MQVYFAMQMPASEPFFHMLLKRFSAKRKNSLGTVLSFQLDNVQPYPVPLCKLTKQLLWWNSSHCQTGFAFVDYIEGWSPLPMYCGPFYLCNTGPLSNMGFCKLGPFAHEIIAPLPRWTTLHHAMQAALPM